MDLLIFMKYYYDTLFHDNDTLSYFRCIYVIVSLVNVMDNFDIVCYIYRPMWRT